MLFLTSSKEIPLNNGINILYFYASWLEYHKKMVLMINKIEKKHNELMFTAIDVDYFKQECSRFNVTSIPTLIIFKNGQEIKRLNGLILTSAFNAAFSDIY